MDLILIVKKSIDDQFKNGIKVKADRLKNVKMAYVIKDNVIVGVYVIDNTHILYNAQTKTIDMQSIMQDKIYHHEYVGKEVEYNTFNPATISTSIENIIK